MNGWFEKVLVNLPESVKEAVDRAEDSAGVLYIDVQAGALVADENEEYVVMKREMFEDWHGRCDE